MIRTRPQFGTLVVAIALLTVVFSDAYAQRTPDMEPIRLARLGLSMYQIPAALIARVLEADGFAVEFVDGPHEELFPKLADGDIDLLVGVWLPYVTVTALWSNGMSFWAVPDYVPADWVRSITDLAKPEVAVRFDKRIPSLGTGTSMYQRSVEIVDAYGLDAEGFKVTANAPVDWVGALEAATAEESWIVFPIWGPHALNASHGLRPLVEPQGIFGGRYATFLVANRDYAKRAPARVMQVLGRIVLDIESMTALDTTMTVQGASADEAIANWMDDNRDVVATWRR